MLNFKIRSVIETTIPAAKNIVPESTKFHWSDLKELKRIRFDSDVVSLKINQCVSKQFISINKDHEMDHSNVLGSLSNFILIKKIFVILERMS